KALQLCDRPVGKMWISKLGRLRCTLQAEIYLQETIVASATQIGFFVNIETMRPMAVPRDLEEIYAQY
nr:acyl-CoA thioesterase [Pleurocapsa sp. MO_226.B13]